jgi:hypothetical protein
MNQIHIKESDQMGESKHELKRKSSSRSKPQKKEKMNAKMFAIALIFVMLFVSYVVIFSGSDQVQTQSKDMVFSQVGVTDTYLGNVKTVNIDLSEINLTIRDANADSTNSNENLTDETTIDTQGNFNCTYHDTNQNGKLDKADEFEVHNASSGDKITITLKSSGKELAYYIF